MHLKLIHSTLSFDEPFYFFIIIFFHISEANSFYFQVDIDKSKRHGYISGHGIPFTQIL